MELVERALEMGLPFRAVVGDILYGEHREFKEGLEQKGIPYVLSLRPSHTWWHPIDEVGWVEAECRAFSAQKNRRLVVATTDPATLPSRTSLYLETNLPAPGSPRADERTRTADLISLRVIHQALQGLARGCKSRIPKRFPLLGVAPYCVPGGVRFQSCD